MFYRDVVGFSVQLRTWFDVTTPWACISWVSWGSLCEPFAFDLRSSCFWNERVPVSPLMQTWGELPSPNERWAYLTGQQFHFQPCPRESSGSPLLSVLQKSGADATETIIGIMFARSKIWSFPEAPKKHNPVLRFWKTMA